MTALTETRIQAAAIRLLEKAAEITEEDGPDTAAAMIRCAITLMVSINEEPPEGGRA